MFKMYNTFNIISDSILNVVNDCVQNKSFAETTRHFVLTDYKTFQFKYEYMKNRFRFVLANYVLQPICRSSAEFVDYTVNVAVKHEVSSCMVIQ
jgi:hypothetical protein